MTSGSSHRSLPSQQPQAQQPSPPEASTGENLAATSTPSGDSSTPIRAPGNGSSSAAILAASMALETQPTVILRPPIAGDHPQANVHPRELGAVLEGQRLGHFELHEFVGGGGMGAVFRGLDTMLNRVVAVKVLSQEQSSDEEVLRRFKNEAQSAARLNHENISRVYYVGEDRGWHYIVFEFIEGTNLRDLVERSGPLPLASAVSYTIQIADALAHASRRDVVHRDIKPSNVLITPADRAMLVDMGLARLHQLEHADDDLTASGVTLGTFDYISPEQARDPRSADVRSDIYSLGCTLYFMITGRPPFPEGTVLQKLLQHQSESPTDPREFRSDLPGEFLSILNQMLSKSPAKRFQTPDDLVAALSTLAHQHGLKTAGPIDLVWLSPEEVRLSPLEKHLPWAAPLVTLVVVVAILNAIWSMGADPVGPPPLSGGSSRSVRSPTGNGGPATASQALETSAAPPEPSPREGAATSDSTAGDSK